MSLQASTLFPGIGHRNIWWGFLTFDVEEPDERDRDHCSFRINNQMHPDAVQDVLKAVSEIQVWEFGVWPGISPRISGAEASTDGEMQLQLIPLLGRATLLAGSPAEADKCPRGTLTG